MSLSYCPIARSSVRNFFFNVYTKKEHRRKGHARILLNMAIDEARHRGVEIVRLDYTDDGFSLYQQMGFLLVEPHMVLHR
ncbi:MAG: GNAT family N-acetyltransferase [Planctomycetes bacterium]|nr:GNAT family N-acetyltransferase [Planctomycetota bacterium]